MHTWTWIVAANYQGSTGIVLEASSDRAIQRFKNTHAGATLTRYTRSAGRHWDGGLLDAARAASVRRGIARIGK